MASAEIGAGNSSRYQGSAALGGGSFGSFQLDVKPIEDLARYTMLYNRAEYDQRQKDAETAANEIADMTSYDLTTGIPKDAKLLQEKYDRLTSYVRENPNALDYRNKKEWAEYKTMRNDLENDLRGGKVRNTMWALRQKEIQDATSTAEKIRLQKRLDQEIADTDIRTPIKHTDQYNVKPVSVSAAPIKKVQVTEIGRNIIGQDNWEMPDMDAVTNQSIAITSGLMNLADFEKTSQFISATPEQQQIYRDQFEAQSASGKLEPIQSAEIFNQAVGNLPGSFYKTDGSGNTVLDMDKLVESENGIIRGVAEQVRIYNQKMQEMKGGIKAGYFVDDFNNQLNFSNDASGLKEASYKEINLDDGLSPQELVKMRILAVSKAPGREIKIIETDDALQAGAQALQRRGQDLDLLNSREGRALQRELATTPSDSGNTQTTGNAFDEIGGTNEISVVSTGTFGRTKGPIGKISNGYVYDKNGKLMSGSVVMPADQLPSNMLSALKAAGTENTTKDENGKVISIPISTSGDVTVTAKDGVIISVKAKGGAVISRQAMENAQKKFDTEAKGQERTQWGRTLETPAPANTNTNTSRWDQYKEK